MDKIVQEGFPVATIDGRYPYMAYLISPFFSEDQVLDSLQCGAHLISPSVLVTSAECLSESIPLELLKIGVNCVPSGFSANCVFENPTETIRENGFVYLKIPTPGTPVDIVDADEVDNGIVGKVIGNGFLNFGSVFGFQALGRMNEAEVSFLGSDDCSTVFESISANSDLVFDSENEFCGDGNVSGGCFLDEGSPFLLACDSDNSQDLSAGVLTGVRGCANTGMPNVFRKYDIAGAISAVSQLTGGAEEITVRSFNTSDCEETFTAPPNPTPPPTFGTDWNCPATAFADAAFCDCECGSQIDPDCAFDPIKLFEIRNCPDTGANFDCVNNECQVFGLVIPPEWTCKKSAYGSGDGCDCGCGAPDLDCDPVVDVNPKGCEDLPACDIPGQCTCISGLCFGSFPTEPPVPAPNEAPVPAPNEAPAPAPNEAPAPAPNEAPAPAPNDAPNGNSDEGLVESDEFLYGVAAIFGVAIIALASLLVVKLAGKSSGEVPAKIVESKDVVPPPASTADGNTVTTGTTNQFVKVDQVGDSTTV